MKSPDIQLLRRFYHLTGGRPMSHVTDLFRDPVSGNTIGLYQDGFQRCWMAAGPWSIFRVQTDGGLYVGNIEA